MFSNNPYAMGTMSPGAMGIMRGMGMGGNSQINGMQQPQIAQMLQQQAQPQQKANFPDVGQLERNAQAMRGNLAMTRNQGSNISTLADQGAYAGPTASGGNLNDDMAKRGAMLQSSPYWGGMMNRLGML